MHLFFSALHAVRSEQQTCGLLGSHLTCNPKRTLCDRTYMSNLLDVPIASVTALTPERAVVVMRAILRSECSYAKQRPSVLTISSRLTTADGGIDAEVNVPSGSMIPTDCIFSAGLTGFQIKSGTSFKPWTPSSIRGELLNSRGELYSEVERLIRSGGRYTLLCTGHDLTQNSVTIRGSRLLLC